MGRAGGGGRVGGGRSGGGSFSRSGGRSSFGGSNFGGGHRSHGSFGGGHMGGFGGVHHRPPHHRPPHHHHHGVHLGPLFWGSAMGRRTVIINNGGNTTTASQNTQNTQDVGSAATYTAPKPLTPEQKIARAERLAKEAGEAKKSALKGLIVALVLLAMGAFVTFVSKGNEYEKISMAGTVYAGYAYDDGFTYNAGRTEAACENFYEETGIPLYFYTIGEYDGEASTCDAYTMELYDELFDDENHVLIAYYDNVDWWSWAIGENAKFYMGEDEVNDLIDKIYVSWDNYSLSNDAVLAEGIERYTDDLTEGNSGAIVFSGLLYIAGGFVALVAIVSYVNKAKDEKRYAEEAQTLRTEQMLSKPLETFGNQEVDDLKEKYDNM